MDNLSQKNWESEEYTKENLEKLFYYGNKVLEELQQSAHTKDIKLGYLDTDLRKYRLRYENLRENIKVALDRY